MSQRNPQHLQSHSPQGRPLQKPAQKRRRIPRLLGIGIALAAVAGVSGVAGALMAVSLSAAPLQQQQLSAEDAEAFNQETAILAGGNLRLPRLTRPVNILVLGVKVLTTDVNEVPPELQGLGYHALVNSFDGLSDSMLLLRFNPQTEQMVVLSLPRDTRTYVRGRLTKLNEANQEGGPALTAEAVSDLLGGVAIDRYVRINVQGVEKLIDALGGVTVNVPQDMKYQDDSQHLYINLKAGEQALNGNQSLQFLRFRYDAQGDIGRIQRQQMFMRALTEQTLNPATITRLPKILSVIQSNVDTNLSVEELLALVGYGAQTNRSNVQMLMLPGTFSRPQDFALSYWLPNYGDIDGMVDQYFGYGTQQVAANRSPSQVRVAIQDSTNNPVAVQALTQALRDSGYSNVVVDITLNEPLPISRIVAQRGDGATAETVHRYLGIGEVLVESTGALNSDITIQLGEDWNQGLGESL
ncbi:MAG: LytR family transcriptional regulator [Shackletoniella antarctica]|uniref:LytR family transcriptional regulator n=1 Tax=Shackletoniella antarctica TaxID=268115 RepID=A0A2W4W214_9CYAN|nr:MAG: LytR family transcriptional regulator [Shackletoniella antarctica]